MQCFCDNALELKKMQHKLVISLLSLVDAIYTDNDAIDFKPTKEDISPWLSESQLITVQCRNLYRNNN